MMKRCSKKLALWSYLNPENRKESECNALRLTLTKLAEHHGLSRKHIRQILASVRKQVSRMSAAQKQQTALAQFGRAVPEAETKNLFADICRADRIDRTHEIKIQYWQDRPRFSMLIDFYNNADYYAFISMYDISCVLNNPPGFAENCLAWMARDPNFYFHMFRESIAEQPEIAFTLFANLAYVYFVHRQTGDCPPPEFSEAELEEAGKAANINPELVSFILKETRGWASINLEDTDDAIFLS